MWWSRDKLKWGDTKIQSKKINLSVRFLLTTHTWKTATSSSLLQVTTQAWLGKQCRNVAGGLRFNQFTLYSTLNGNPLHVVSITIDLAIRHVLNYLKATNKVALSVQYKTHKLGKHLNKNRNSLLIMLSSINWLQRSLIYFMFYKSTVN